MVGGDSPIPGAGPLEPQNRPRRYSPTVSQKVRGRVGFGWDFIDSYPNAIARRVVES